LSTAVSSIGNAIVDTVQSVVRCVGSFFGWLGRLVRSGFDFMSFLCELVVGEYIDCDRSRVYLEARTIHLALFPPMDVELHAARQRALRPILGSESDELSLHRSLIPAHVCAQAEIGYDGSSWAMTPEFRRGGDCTSMMADAPGRRNEHAGARLRAEAKLEFSLDNAIELPTKVTMEFEAALTVGFALEAWAPSGLPSVAGDCEEDLENTSHCVGNRTRISLQRDLRLLDEPFENPAAIPVSCKTCRASPVLELVQDKVDRGWSHELDSTLKHVVRMRRLQGLTHMAVQLVCQAHLPLIICKFQSSLYSPTPASIQRQLQHLPLH